MNPCYDSRSRNLLFALSFGIVLPFAAPADTATWLGGTGNWTDAANWSAETVPVDDAETDPKTDVILDADPSTASVVTWTLTADSTQNHYLGRLLIDDGDSLTFTGKPGGNGSTYSRLYLDSLSNSGTLTMNGPSATKTHGNEFLLGISGPTNAPFNTAIGRLIFKSISNYRRNHNYVNLPEIAQNDGYFRAESRMTQYSGHVTLRLPGRGHPVEYINNGDTYLVGKGDGNAWVTLSPTNRPNNSFTLSGTGTVHLASATGTGDNNGKARAMVAAVSTGIPFLHASGHTIVGCGNVGHTGSNESNSQARMSCQNFQSIVNEGTILAQRYVNEEEALSSSISNLVITAGSGIVSNAPSGKIVAGTPGSVASLQIGSGSGTFINAGLLEIAAGSTCSNACATTLAESSVFRFGIDASVMTVEAFEEWLSQRPDPSEVEPSEGGEAGVEEPSEEPEPDPILKGILDVTGTLVLGGRMELVEGSRPVINGTYRIATFPPNAVSGSLPSVVRTGSQPGFTLILNAENGTLDAFFPAPETVILVR